MDKARFVALWERCLVDGLATDGEVIFRQLLQHYSEPHRRYHTPEHIDHCLGQFDLVVNLVDDPDAVEMAIWFHDIIYDVPSTDNERRSAQLFLESADGRIDPSFGRNVYDMIMATTHHEPPERTDDKYLVDVDLSSFGLPWKRFKRDSENVRDEFASRSDQQFYSAHMKFMQSLVDRKNFYATEFFRGRYEKQARKNVERLIGELRSAGFS